jgi:hypothetical protein
VDSVSAERPEKNRHQAEAALRGIAAKVSVNMLNHNNGPAGVWAY